MADVLALSMHDLAASRARAAVSAAGIGLGVTVLTVVLGLGMGTRNVVLEQVVQSLPVDTLEVLPRRLNLGLFAVDTQALLGGKRAFDDAVVAELGRIEGVAHVYPKLDVSLPLGARGGARLLGRPLYTDLFMTGLPRELIEREVPSGFADPGDVVPVVISNQLIEIYNASVAPALGTPQLTAATLRGFEFDIVVGRSLMLGRRGASREGIVRGRIVGASRYALRLGVTVPMETAQRLLTTYGDPQLGKRYASVLLKARSATDVVHIAERVEEMGYRIDETADETRKLMTAATALAGAVGFLVLLLAALNIAHSFFASLSERRRELAILRALGARRGDLITLVLVQASVLGLIGGCAGLGGAHVVAATLDWAAATWLPGFPFKPESFFYFPPILHALGVAAAVAAAIGGAAWPAARAARAQVCEALAA